MRTKMVYPKEGIASSGFHEISGYVVSHAHAPAQAAR